MINKLVRRLKKIGIDIELRANYPWIYLYKVNGIIVTEKFNANHGFTAFYLTASAFSWSDRHKVFTKIREML